MRNLRRLRHQKQRAGTVVRVAGKRRRDVRQKRRPVPFTEGFSDKDWNTFFHLIEHPPEPNVALREAYRRYKEGFDTEQEVSLMDKKETVMEKNTPENVIELVVPCYEDPFGRFLRLHGEMYLQHKGKQICINFAELIGNAELDTLCFVYNGRTYRKMDLMDQFMTTLTAQERTDLQKMVLHGLSHERRQHIEALTGIDVRTLDKSFC